MGILDKYKKKKKQAPKFFMEMTEDEMSDFLKEEGLRLERYGVIPSVRLPTKWGFDEVIPFIGNMRRAPIGELACPPFFSDFSFQDLVSFRYKDEETVFDELIEEGSWASAQILPKEVIVEEEKYKSVVAAIQAAFRKSGAFFLGEFLPNGFGVVAFEKSLRDVFTELWRTELRKSFDWSLSLEISPEEAFRGVDMLNDLQGGDFVLVHHTNHFLHTGIMKPPFIGSILTKENFEKETKLKAR